jgi:hypothetical protein
MRPFSTILTILCISNFLAFGQAAQTNNGNRKDSIKTYTTHRLAGEAPEIDGNLGDPAWKLIEWGGGDFRQLSPDKGKPASVQTRFKLIYDDKNLYVAIQCLDPEPSKIVKRMSRRDSFEGDMVEINIDSYYDKRTAFSFTASVSGVKGDEYVSNNGEDWDEGWDPIWYLHTSIDQEGWNAEFRIPLSQLRFANKEELVWGLEITRIFFRNQEKSIWQYIPPDAGGWVHLFGELNGISGIKPQKQLEIQPFVVAQTESFQQEIGNPYRTGTDQDFNAGLDAKIGITSDITLDLTVNPDFGQVEADPSQVNLTAFELYFQERRPFFIEGSNILNFPVGQLNNNNLFYSRRIGRPPQVVAQTDAGDIDDGVPENVQLNKNSTILGAAKITGKNKKGFSWAVLESYTQREHAEIDSLGYKRKQVIEPATNYLVSRVQQDINKGNTLIGGIFTAVNRSMSGDENLMAILHDEAYTGGIDFTHHWKKRTYYVSGRASMSHVKGTKEAISNTQLSSERFFQRPDNYHKDYDPDRTSLTGTGGQLIIGKKSGNIISDLGVVWQSPEFELNDIGFLAQTDNISQWFWMQYRVQEPKGITRSQRYNINEWREFDFGKRLIASGYNINAHATFKNFWAAGGGITMRVHSVSNGDLRGGPSIRYPGGMYYWSYIESDNRKKLSGEVYTEIFKGNDNYSNNVNLDLEFTYKPINALNLSLSGSYFKNNNQMQWVTSTEEDPKYVVGEIDQTMIRISLRATLMITPNLSIQYWGQPFGMMGKYNNFKTITDSRAAEYENRFMPISPSAMVYSDGNYEADLDGNGMRESTFSNPDFNFGQMRSNMVIRWEYIPGSTVFLVWNRERNGSFYEDSQGKKYMAGYRWEFPDKPLNIFLIKFTYRFVL